MDSFTYIAISVPLILIGVVLCKFLFLKGNLNRSVWTSIAFYLGLAAAVVIINFISDNFFISVLLASGVISLGVLIWVFEWRIEKLRRVELKDFNKLSWSTIFILLFVLSGLISLLYIKPLPWAGERAVEMGQSVREMFPSYDKINERIKNRLGGGPTGQEQTNSQSQGFGNRRELPRSGSITLSDDEVMYLRIPNTLDFESFISRPNYVRSRVLDKYTGDAWELSEKSKVWRNDESDGVKDDWVVLSEGDGVEHEVFLPSTIGASLPSIQNPIRFKLDFIMDSGANNYDAEIRGAVRYKAISNPLVWDQDNESIRPGKSSQQYSTSVGGNLGRRVKLLVNEIIGFDRKTSHQKLNLILNYLRTNYKYSTTVENAENASSMENFLFSEKSGWCDYFASAAAILAREVGFPSRTAYGYSGGVSHKKDQIISYRSKDAHSWAEVLVQNVGWVVIDATPPGTGAAVASEKKLGSSNLPSPENFRDANLDEVEVVQQEVEVEKKKTNTLFIWLAALLGICIILIIKQLISLIAKNKPEFQEGEGEKNYVLWDKNSPPYLIEFLKMCIDCGRPKAKGETIREAIKNLRGLIKEDDGSFDDLVSYHYSIQYAGASRDSSVESKLKRTFKKLRKNKN